MTDVAWISATTVLVVGVDGVHSWDLSTATQASPPLAVSDSPADGVLGSPRADRFLVHEPDGQLSLWRYDRESERMARLENATISDVVTYAWSPNGMLLATGHGDGTVRYWDADTAETVSEALKVSTFPVQSVTWSSDSSLSSLRPWTGCRSWCPWPSQKPASWLRSAASRRPIAGTRPIRPPSPSAPAELTRALGVSRPAGLALLSCRGALRRVD